MIVRIISVAVLGALIVACSGGSNNKTGASDLDLLDQNNGTPLSTAQKNSFTDVVTSLERLDLAGRGADSGRTVDDAQAENMRLRLRNTNCDIEIANPGTPPKDRDYSYEYKFNVTGATCPISQVAVSQISQQSTNRIYGSVNVRYSVNDATYSGYNDVSALEFDDYLEGKFSFPRGGTAIVGTGKGNGFVTSQLFGRIDIKSASAIDVMLESAGIRGGLEQITTLTFPTFTVYLRSKQFYSGRDIIARYYLNGVEIKDVDFKRYTKYLSLTDAERYGFIQ